MLDAVSSTQTPDTTGARRVLVVDDNTHLVDMIELALEASDWQVDVFVSPLQAVHAGRNQRYDVVLTDMRMPQLTGAQLVAELRAMPGNAQLPAVIMSGQSIEDHGLDVLPPRCQYLRKPFNTHELEAALQAVLSA